MRLMIASVFLFAVMAHAQGKNISGKIAYLSLTTAKVKTMNPEVDEFAPSVLLRFTKQGSSSEFLAMTDKYGVATIPIEAGTYCAEAFGLDGQEIRLSERSSSPLSKCFTIAAGKAQEFSLTLAMDAKYGGKTPPFVVE